MKPTEILMHEHRVIERVLASLETGARRLQAGEPVPAGFFLQAADFIRDFADGCHHRKEEGALFPALEAAGLPRDGGPVGVMLGEHEEGRQYTRAMRAGAERLAAGDTTAREAIVRNALDYAAMLRGHIAKEDAVLFVMADKVITGDEQARLAAEFERIEAEETGAGTHEKYVAMADALEREVRP